MRVTQSIIYDRFVYYLEGLNEGISKSLARIASGKKILRPSDDPAATVTLMQMKSEVSGLDEYKRNIERTRSWMRITETALKSMEDLLKRAEELAVEGGSDNTTPEARKALAAEVGELLDRAKQIANAKFGNFYVFSGYNVLAQPFIDSDNLYHVDDGIIRVNVGPGMTASMNIPGSIFTNGVNIFQALEDLRDALESNDGDAARAQVDLIRSGYENITSVHAELGSMMRRLEISEKAISDRYEDLINILDKMESTDIAKETTTLYSYQTSYRATLAGVSKVMQTNLFDYLG